MALPMPLRLLLLGVRMHREESILVKLGDRIQLIRGDHLHHPVDVLLVALCGLACPKFSEECENLLHRSPQPLVHGALAAHGGSLTRALQLVDDDGQTEQADHAKDVEEVDGRQHVLGNNGDDKRHGHDNHIDDLNEVAEELLVEGENSHGDLDHEDGEER